MTTIYSKEWFIENVAKFEKMYYTNNITIKGISIPTTNRTKENIEKKAEQYEKLGMVDIWIAAWKMGRIDDEGNIEYLENGNIRNGYGKEVHNISKYIDEINTSAIRDLIMQGKLTDAYSELLKKCPDNFGPVYIINLMHFISHGMVPIYDKFAHKAAKALYAIVNPNEIYVGMAPDKKDIVSVVNMLNEYMWLLKKIFDKSAISRKLDRALWVYGHATKQFNGVILL